MDMDAEPSAETDRRAAAESRPPERLAAARRGDPLAFDGLVRPLLGSLLALCRRLVRRDLAEDLLQEGLVRAWRGLADFRGEASFRSWLVGILYRLAAEPERLLRAGRSPAAGPLAGPVPESLDRGPLQRAGARDLLGRVEQAMERLPRRQRTALHLRAVEGWDYGEIARSLAASEGAIRTAVFEARKRLRSRLGDLLG